MVRGWSRDARVTLGHHSGTASVKWSRVDAYDTADALAGPWAIPFAVVRYPLHPAVGGEATVSLPLSSDSSWWIATTPRTLGGKTIQFALAPQFPTSVASAAAGAAISRELGGTLTGEPERVLVSHGVHRPARAMRLDRPLALGPLHVDGLLVRTADYGPSGVIRDEFVDPAEAPDAVVIRGRRKPTRASYTVYLGADALAGCPAVAYDKPPRLIQLTCR